MKALIQVVNEARVTADGEELGSIGRGLTVFLGVCDGDGREDAEYLADKLVQLRIMQDDQGKMNLSVEDVNGELLVISQFTLCGKISSGRRPSFSHAAAYADAKDLYEYFLDYLAENTILTVETGEFGAYMDVELTNDGPVTFMLEA
ncbi:MAG: D-aminoacyl-tRNA deacylase [Candidatus Acetothermia bacterium]